MGPQIEKMAAKAVMAVVMGKGLHSSEMGELLHLLRHVGHAVKEAFDTFVEGPEENNGRRRMPGGPEFIDRVDAAAGNLARFFIDTDETTIRADLVQSRVNLEASLSKILGRTSAVQIAEAFVEAVIEHCRRLRRAK